MVGRVHALLREQLTDEPVARDNAVRVEQQQRKECALLRPAGRDERAVHADRERPKDPELDSAAGYAAGFSCDAAPSATRRDTLGTGLGYRSGTLALAMLFTAKCYWPGVGEDELRAALSEADVDPKTTFRGALSLPGDELVLCLFDAPSRVSVKNACERAGWPCERVIESLWIDSAGGGTR